MTTAYAHAMFHMSTTNRFTSRDTVVNLMRKDPKCPYKGMMELIKSVSNYCSNLMKLGHQVVFGLSQAHKKAHALIRIFRVFSHKVYYSIS